MAKTNLYTHTAVAYLALARLSCV